MSARHEVYSVSRRLPGEVTSRVVRFVLSTEIEDRAGDTIDQSGWDLKNYLQNPVVLWCHDNNAPPIGKMVRLGVEGASLIGDVEFASAEQNPFAETIFQLVKGGFVNAGSVGFRPTRFEINAKGGLDFKEQELLEYSIVGVPCNPQALSRLKSAGFDMDAASAALNDFRADDSDVRKALMAEARDNAARSLATFKRAIFVREKQFQQAAR